MTFPFTSTQRSLFCLCLASLFPGAWVPASPAPLDEALKALDEGVAEVAIVKLQQQLAAPAPLPPELRSLAKTKLAEALLAAGRTDEALRQMQDPEVKAPLLEARIQAAEENWTAALALYSAAAADPKAMMGKAECLFALDRLPEAIATLESIAPQSPAAVSLRLGEFYLQQNRPDACARLLSRITAPLNTKESKWKDYLEARLLLAQKTAKETTVAYQRFQALAGDPRNGSGEMLLGSIIGMAASRTELTGLTAADDILEQFIWRHPESPYLAALFRKLDAVYAGEENPSTVELQKLALREPALRSGFATYYLAKALVREEKPENALAVLENFGGRFPNHPLLSQALLMQGRLLSNSGKFSPSQKAFEEAMLSANRADLRAEIELASASAHFKAGDFVLAATLFHNAGEHCPALMETARFNTALSWLHQGNFQRFAREYQGFCQAFPESPLRAELSLEEGLLRARNGNPEAVAALQKFIHDFPEHLRVPEARLTLAELRYMDNDLAAANQFLQVVNTSPAPSKTAEDSDYLAIFVADDANTPSGEKVIALCRSFIERHPASELLPKVRMKLGQIHFRNGDFASAQAQFETLALEAPASPLAEPALFLAAQASTKRIDAVGIDRAVELFNNVASRDGPLKFHARLQLAALQNRLGKEADAAKLYDDILRANPAPEIKSAALTGKADNLFALGAKEKTFYEQALAVYGQLASEPGISPVLQHRAFYGEGRCLEKLSRPEEALAAYYRVVDSGTDKPTEYFWFYKAGFDACRLSESREQWKTAIAIYQKMAAMEGPRAEEAKERMTQLRMEHFIWDNN